MMYYVIMYDEMKLYFEIYVAYPLNKEIVTQEM